MVFVFLIAVFYFSSEVAFTQQYITAKQVQNNISIDGIMNEPVWISADSINNFIQIEPNIGKPGVHKTVVRIIYNSYFFS